MLTIATGAQTKPIETPSPPWSTSAFSNPIVPRPTTVFTGTGAFSRSWISEVTVRISHQMRAWFNGPWHFGLHRSQLPGADETTPLLVVSRAGIAVDGPVAFLPEDLLAAWRGCLRWRGERPEADRTASAAPDAQGGPAGVSESMAGLGRTDHREDVRETMRGWLFSCARGSGGNWLRVRAG